MPNGNPVSNWKTFWENNPEGEGWTNQPAENKPGAAPRPTFDYVNWPYMSTRGYVNHMNVYFTQSLFLETYKYRKGAEDIIPVYTMLDTERYWARDNIWLPSARLIYVMANSEYDAMRKLVGSARQWELLKSKEWFVRGASGLDGQEKWQQEQDARKADEAERLLRNAAEKGDIQSAKTLFSMYRKKPVGRPNKPVVDVNREGEDAQIAADAQLLELVKS